MCNKHSRRETNIKWDKLKIICTVAASSFIIKLPLWFAVNILKGKHQKHSLYGKIMSLHHSSESWKNNPPYFCMWDLPSFLIWPAEHSKYGVIAWKKTNNRSNTMKDWKTGDAIVRYMYLNIRKHTIRGGNHLWRGN